MSLKSSNKIETNTYEIEVTINAEDFAAGTVVAYKKERHRYSVPGFRKGKAPKHMIENYYGEDVFYEGAVEYLFPGAVTEALKEGELESVDNPYDIKIDKIGKDGVEMTMKITVKPDVTVKQYKGLEASKANVDVTDEEVDAEISRMRERNAVIQEVTDRPAQTGDTCAIDYDGSVDGVPFDGGKGSHDLVLGSGTFIPGFEDQVVGHSIGEEFDVCVTFPEDYHAEELAGKEAVFHVKLNGIKEKILPELDDEFAKDVSEDADTFEELKESIRKEITEQKQKTVDADFEQELLVGLSEQVEGEIPQCMFDQKAEENKTNFENRIKQNGIDLELYLMYMGVEKERFEEDMMKQAVQQVKVRLALDKIAQLEGITVSDEDLEEEYQKLSDMYGVSVDAVKSFFDEEQVKRDIAAEKVIRIIKDNAVIVEKKEEPEEPESAEEEPAAETPAE